MHSNFVAGVVAAVAAAAAVVAAASAASSAQVRPCSFVVGSSPPF